MAYVRNLCVMYRRESSKTKQHFAYNETMIKFIRYSSPTPFFPLLILEEKNKPREQKKPRFSPFDFSFSQTTGEPKNLKVVSAITV